MSRSLLKERKASAQQGEVTESRQILVVLQEDLHAELRRIRVIVRGPVEGPASIPRLARVILTSKTFEHCGVG